MRILVWKGYGEIDVHCIETVPQVEAIALSVLEIVKDWHLDETLTFKTHLDTVLESHRLVGEEKTRAAILRLTLDFVQDHCQGDDSFERFQTDRIKY